MAKKSIWTLDLGLEIVRGLQTPIRKWGYHLTLGGSVLNKGTSEKDLDLYFLPMSGNGKVRPDSDGLVDFLDTLWAFQGDLGNAYGFKVSDVERILGLANGTDGHMVDNIGAAGYTFSAFQGVFGNQTFEVPDGMNTYTLSTVATRIDGNGNQRRKLSTTLPFLLHYQHPTSRPNHPFELPPVIDQMLMVGREVRDPGGRHHQTLILRYDPTMTTPDDSKDFKAKRKYLYNNEFRIDAFVV